MVSFGGFPGQRGPVRVPVADTPPEVSDAFKAVVLSWLKTVDPQAKRVDAVTAYGTDWAGDTEGGFYSEADVTIWYFAPAGEKRSREIRGEEMGDLWQHVMLSWPADQDTSHA